MIKLRSTQKGFSLIEMLLTVVILTSLLLVVFNIIKNYSENVLAKSNASYLSQINEAAYDIIKNPTYFSAIHQRALNLGGNLEISLDNLRSGFMAGPTPIPASSILADNFADFTPYKTGVHIIFRVADTGVPNSVSSLEIFISTDNLIETERVIKSASYLDMNGGYYLTSADGVKNAFGAWDFLPSRYNGTAWNAQVSSDPPSLTDGGYIISYRHVTFDDVTGDYLFRTRVIGRPELNQMRTNLNLGGYNILNADDIDPNGSLTLSSGAIVKGSMQIGNALTNGMAAFNQSNFYAGRTVGADTATINGLGTGVRGNLNVEGGIRTTNLTTTQSIDATSATFERGLTTNQTINVNAISQITNINSNNVNTTLYNGGSGTNRPSLTIGNSLKTGRLETSQLNINGSGRTGMLDLTLSGNLSANNLTSSTIVIPTLNVGNFGACDNGC